MTNWPSSLTMRPILAWPITPTRNRKISQFSAPMRDTLAQLDKEFKQIGARNVVMQIALEEQQFRNDGYPRAGARPEHPGVILSLETPEGPLSFPCDTFTTWEDNLRAITLTLEKLRAINRYGVTRNAQQYSSFRAIDAPRVAPSTFTSEEDALTFLARTAGVPPSQHSAAALIRYAQRAAHPDHGGSSELMSRVSLAQEFLRSAGLV